MISFDIRWRCDRSGSAWSRYPHEFVEGSGIRSCIACPATNTLHGFQEVSRTDIEGSCESLAGRCQLLFQLQVLYAFLNSESDVGDHGWFFVTGMPISQIKKDADEIVH